METFDLTITAEVGREYVRYLRSNIQQAKMLIKSPLQELSIALVDDETMTTLHQEFMSINTTTDVLTFPLEMDAQGRVTAGEVVVCLPEAKRRAKVEKTKVKNELLLYAIHGVLHLSGFDDRTARDYKKMHAKEDEILTAVGVGATFSPIKSKKR